jgi:SAM-dependent methyltransferase
MASVGSGVTDAFAHYCVPERYYALQLERLLAAAPSTAPPHELFAGVSDDFWLWLNTEGCRQSSALQRILPELPEEEVQLNANGLSGDHALADGFLVYRLFREIYEGLRDDLRVADVLDFGCGWGRVIRFFLKDLDASRLWGIDHWDKHVEICRRTNLWANFERNEPFPPTRFRDGSFDLVFAYSVFSHLSEDAHEQWLGEFRRLLRPGGVFIATTWGRDLLERCAQLQGADDLLLFQTHLPTMFGGGTEEWLARYDRGEYCFDSSPEAYGEISYYLGETCIPETYVREQWTRYLNFVDFIHDRTVSPQNVAVMRK